MLKFDFIRLLQVCTLARTIKSLLFLFLPLSLLAQNGYFEPWGKDEELNYKNTPPLMPPPPQKVVGKIAESLILFNQNYLSPAYGPRSHFRPTSSRYTLLCMRRYGFIKGFIMGCDRLLRENSDPWVYRITVIDNTSYKWEPSYRSLKEVIEGKK